MQLRNATERPDPLKGLRRRFFKQRSHWIPHCNDFPEVHSYLKKTEADILLSFYQFKLNSRRRGNLTMADAWAAAWLRDNPSVIDCPADKGLGPVLISRCLYDDLALSQLQKGYVSIDHNQVQSIVLKTRQAIADAMLFGLQFDLVPAKVVEFATCLRCKFRYPIARLLVKLHKPQVEGRLIASGTSWITNPIAVLLAAT